jgi:hypothetical protein
MISGGSGGFDNVVSQMYGGSPIPPGGYLEETILGILLTAH